MNETPVQALRRVARRAMVEAGLATDFSAEAQRQLSQIAAPAHENATDLRTLLWCSIDNDESRDLDQLSVCEELPAGAVRIRVAVADVDALVHAGTPLDAHAAQNTTSVYTAAQIFPMLPERLSTDLTSLNADQDRIALIVEYVVSPDGTTSAGSAGSLSAGSVGSLSAGSAGSLSAGTISRAQVRNRAKLAYDSVAAWLEGKGPLPAPAARVPGMERQLRVQDEVAQRLRKRRLAAGALELQSIEPRAVIEGEQVVGLREQEQNRARQLIEEFMVAANGISAQFLAARKLPALARVVRSPERWARIVALAAGYQEALPAEPDSRALDLFLQKRRAADPLRFPDLSLTVVKLMGRSEYVAEPPGGTSPGHFGLAVRDYSHTTAPNRRFPDLVTHRQLKAALAGAQPAYGFAALADVAARCTQMESAATKVERLVRKSAAALVLQKRIGEVFDAFVTGATAKGTFVRVLAPPAEGRVLRGESGLKVGDRIRVQLVATDFERGFIDFARAR